MFTSNTLTFQYVINRAKKEELPVLKTKVINYIELFVILLVLSAGVYLLSCGVMSAVGWDASWPHPLR